MNKGAVEVSVHYIHCILVMTSIFISYLIRSSAYIILLISLTFSYLTYSVLKVYSLIFMWSVYISISVFPEWHLSEIFSQLWSAFSLWWDNWTSIPSTFSLPFLSSDYHFIIFIHRCYAPCNERIQLCFPLVGDGVCRLLPKCYLCFCGFLLWLLL